MLNDFTQQLQGWVIGFVKEQALTKIDLSRWINSVQKPYRVIVTSSELGKNNIANGVVVAKLQEQFTLAVDSKWYSFLEGLVTDRLTAIANMGMQAIVGKTFSLAVASRRMWIGSSPLTITLPMIFMAESDASAEVVEQVRRLQMMALPSGGTTGGDFLIPPGPNPFNSFSAPGVGRVNTGERGDIISISIGEFLQFKQVIIKSVSVTYDHRMSAVPRGKPITARAEVVFETYEIFTKEKLAEAYAVPAQASPYTALDKVLDVLGGNPEF